MADELVKYTKEQLGNNEEWTPELKREYDMYKDRMKKNGAVSVASEDEYLKFHSVLDHKQAMSMAKQRTSQQQSQYRPQQQPMPPYAANADEMYRRIAGK